MTRVKICGITEPEDARDAVLLGADAIGLNFYEKSPRYIDAARAAKIIDSLPPFVSVVGVFVNHPDPQNLEDLALSLGLHAVQLHGNETPDYCSMIQRVKVIKALRVDSNFRVESLRSYGSRMFLLDSRARRRSLAARARFLTGTRLWRQCLRFDRPRRRSDIRRMWRRPCRGCIHSPWTCPAASNPRREKRITKRCGGSSKPFAETDVALMGES